MYSVKVVGESFYERHLAAICGRATSEMREHYRMATLILEDDNPHDSNAVRVEIDGGQVGHLSRADAVRFRAIRRQVSSRFECPAMIIAFLGGQDAACDYGVRLQLEL